MFDVGELEEVNLNDIFSQFMPDIYDIQSLQSLSHSLPITPLLVK